MMQASCRPRFRSRVPFGERPPVLVDPQFRKCVVTLWSDVPNKEAGVGVVTRAPIGTGFLVAVPVSSTHRVVYVVTAGHVVTESRPYGPVFLRINREDGMTEVEGAPDSWFFHRGTDIAIARLRLPGDHDVRWLLPDQLATESYVAENKVGPGDDVFFSGLFVQHPGRERDEPIVRFGTVAAMPSDLVRIEVTQGTYRDVRAYLVEGHSWGGQSGSPAFLFYRIDRDPTEQGLVVGSSRFGRLLGIVQGHFDIPRKVEKGEVGFRAGQVRLNAGIAIVLPAQNLLDLVIREDVVEDREQVTTEDEPSGTADSATGESEYDRFEDLTRKLVNVPKKELDEKRLGPSGP
jgi:hypothetical protein